MKDLIQNILNGNRRALARMLTMVENEREGYQQALAALFPHTGHAWVIGITGAPGTGKSSLVNALAQKYRQQDKTVGILAVDPTSPFTGGAILGDRIRMRDLYSDPGVFIRSMATRGSLGGLSRATRDAIRVMDAGGFDVILVETVGAGQSEVDIVRTAQTTIVVEAPGLGDDIQAIKAGILEIADILVVNKADRVGAKNTVQALKMMLEIGHPAARTQPVLHHGELMQIENHTSINPTPLWIPPIIQTITMDFTGIDALIQAIENHRAYIEQNHLSAEIERERIRIELYERLQNVLMTRLMNGLTQQQIEAVVERVRTRELEPSQAVMMLIDMHNTEGML
ncbi:MAG: methylmalonyl Co-A mutase-associated GTPase MeaB [Chloroflexi bacterium]|nr:MAG: methylmalonyl Co-A mutase-associated GTPase MeaB [Chloroflexota bacterium]